MYINNMYMYIGSFKAVELLIICVVQLSLHFKTTHSARKNAIFTLKILKWVDIYAEIRGVASWMGVPKIKGVGAC